MKRQLCLPSPLTGGFQMLPKSSTNTTICWSREIQVWRSGWEGLRWWLIYVQQTWETSWWGQNYHQLTGDEGQDVVFNLASKSAARQGVSVVSTQPAQVHTPAPWPTRPGQLSRGSPVTTPTWSIISPVLMGLEDVKENQPNMSEKWAPQGRVETGVQSTSTNLVMIWQTSTFCRLRKSEAQIPLSLKREKVFG